MFLRLKLTVNAEVYLIYFSLTSGSGTFLEPAYDCKVPFATHVTLYIYTLWRNC